MNPNNGRVKQVPSIWHSSCIWCSGGRRRGAPGSLHTKLLDSRPNFAALLVVTIEYRFRLCVLALIILFNFAKQRSDGSVQVGLQAPSVGVDSRNQFGLEIGEKLI